MRLVASVNRDLPDHHRVRTVRAVTAIPRSANGKIERRVLRDELVAVPGTVVPA